DLPTLEVIGRWKPSRPATAKGGVGDRAALGVRHDGRKAQSSDLTRILPSTRVLVSSIAATSSASANRLVIAWCMSIWPDAISLITLGKSQEPECPIEP